MARTNLTDLEILKGLEKNDKSMIAFLYRMHQEEFVKFSQFKYNLTSSEAEDAYSNAILACIRNVKNQKFERKSSLKTYLKKIFVNKSYDELRKRPTNKSIPIHEHVKITDQTVQIEDPSTTLEIQDEATNMIEGPMRLLPDNCRALILALVYYEREPEEVMSEFGYKDRKALSDRKRYCLNILRKNLHSSMN